MSDKDEPIDNNAALLKSLESIKALLAQSETKLSAARESLHIANQGTAMRKTKANNDIPTLEEIIEVGQQIQIDLPDEADLPVVHAAIEELAEFNVKVENDVEETEPTMTLDTSAFAFDDQDVDDDSLSDIPVLSIDALDDDANRDARPYPAPAATPAAATAAVVEAQDEPAVVATSVPLPDLGPLLDAIDDAEGNMRAQISAAAIAFEDQLNTQLDAQMRQLRERVYALVEKYGA